MTCELTSVTCELTSATRELTSERLELTSVAWRVHMNQRGMPVATVDVISERYSVAARREEALGAQRVMADERQCVPVMDEDVPATRQRLNAAGCSAPRHRGDASKAREGVVTARSEVSPTWCE